jgi:hypothetical protein
MTADDFTPDDVWQREKRDQILAPGFYEIFSPGQYLFVDQSRMTKGERRATVDTFAHSPVDGKLRRFEEKIWRAPRVLDKFTNYPLETKSCTVSGRETDGWMLYSPASILLGAFCNREETALDVHLLDLPELKQWFWPRESHFKIHVHEHTLNHSEARLVPFNALPPGILLWRGIVRPLRSPVELWNAAWAQAA